MSEPASPAAETSRVARSSEKAQRLRVRFSRGEEAADIGHLDLARVWERALLDSDIAVSYSQGNRPHARITLAAGLPAGVTSEGELIDIVLAEHITPREFVERVRTHLPAGLAPIDAREVGMRLPSLPSALRWADYEVDVPVGENGTLGKIDAFLSSETFPWEDTRGEKIRRYDLRTLVLELHVGARRDGVLRLSMRLRCEAAGVGRPDQVIKALGLPEASRIHRTRLGLSETSPAREAWRRKGRFVG